MFSLKFSSGANLKEKQPKQTHTTKQHVLNELQSITRTGPGNELRKIWRLPSSSSNAHSSKIPLQAQGKETPPNRNLVQPCVSVYTVQDSSQTNTNSLYKGLLPLKLELPDHSISTWQRKQLLTYAWPIFWSHGPTGWIANTVSLRR